MTPQQKRLLFTLRAQRTLSLLWWPVTVMSAAVDGYFEAFFMALTPPSAARRGAEEGER